MATAKSPKNQEAASARVVSALREAVNNKSLMPGEHIRQDYWADKLEVSRIPIREALKILSSQGFLDHIPHRGYFVQKIGADQLRQIYRLLEIIETEICATIRWPSKDELKTFKALANRTVERFLAKDYIGAYDDDQALIQKLWDLSPNDFYAKEARRLLALCEVNRLQAAWLKNVSDTRYKEYYKNIIRALTKQDLDGLMKMQHLKHQYALDALERIL